MTTLQLEQRGWHNPDLEPAIRITKLRAPFFVSQRGRVVHRPRYASLQGRHTAAPWLAVQAWCGVVACSPRLLLDSDTVCATCEARAVANGGAVMVCGTDRKFHPYPDPRGRGPA